MGGKERLFDDRSFFNLFMYRSDVLTSLDVGQYSTCEFDKKKEGLEIEEGQRTS